MEFKTYMDNLFNEETSDYSKKNIPVKPDNNSDPAVIQDGVAVPNKSGSISNNPPPGKMLPRKWAKVNSWDDLIKKNHDVSGK